MVDSKVDYCSVNDDCKGADVVPQYASSESMSNRHASFENLKTNSDFGD